MNRLQTSNRFVLPILGLAACLAILACIGACSRSVPTSPTTASRQFARAVQGFAQGAEIGSFCAPDDQFQERDPNPNAYVGELLFSRYCAPCHSTGKAPNIVEKRVTQSDAESDYYIIRYGLREMPGFRMRLTQYQVFDILAYMKTDFGDFIKRHRRIEESTRRK